MRKCILGSNKCLFQWGGLGLLDYPKETGDGADAKPEDADEIPPRLPLPSRSIPSDGGEEGTPPPKPSKRPIPSESPMPPKNRVKPSCSAAAGGLLERTPSTHAGC